MSIAFYDVKQAEGILDELSEIKEKLESKINLSARVGNEKKVTLPQNKVMRICFLVGLSQTAKRTEEDFKHIQISKMNQRIVASFFTMNDLGALYSALLKIRYADLNVDWTNVPTLSRIIASEMLRGRDYLNEEVNMDSFLYSLSSKSYSLDNIPALNLMIGNYGDAEMEAALDVNSRSITNSQILVAGATGSG